MSSLTAHQSFRSPRQSQSLCNDGCQAILYKAVFEHFKTIPSVAAFLLTCKSFQNSSFGANLAVRFKIDEDTICLFDGLLSPSSCFSLQFVPTLHFESPMYCSKKVEDSISNLVCELIATKYLPLQLRTLTLDGPRDIRDFFDSSVVVWPQLRYAHLIRYSLCATTMKLMSESAPHLMSLSFQEVTGVNDEVLRHVATLGSLTSLNLARCTEITNVGMEHVSKLSNITSLDLTMCSLITEPGIEHVSKLTRMQDLNLAYCSPLTDGCLLHVSHLIRLTSLNLYCCTHCTDAGIEHVSKLPNIQSLNLYCCQHITDVGLKHLSALSRITSLNLAGCDKITDAGLEHLAELSNISSLDLGQLKLITDVGVQRICKCANISFLSLSFCEKITDVALQRVSRLPNILTLNLYSCDKITIEEKKKFKAAHPNCRVYG